MKNIGDLRDLVYWMYNKIKNGNVGSGSGVTTTQLNNAVSGKVDKVAGKDLSTNDYTNADKTKVNTISNKLDKGTYNGTAQDLKDAIDTVNSKTITWNDVHNKPELDFILESWNRRNNKEIIRTQVDEWLRINELNSHTNGVYFGTSTVRTDGQVQVGEDGAEAVLSNLGLILKKRLRINGWAGGDGADIKCKGKMQIGSVSGIIEFRKILDDLVNWNGNSTIILDITDGKITSKVLDTNRVNLFGEANNIYGWNGGIDIQCRQNALQLGALNVIKFRKLDTTGWKSDFIEMNVNDGTLRASGFKSNSNSSAEYTFATNGTLTHLPTFIGICGQISGTWNVTSAWYGRHINIIGATTVNLTTMGANQTITFRKCYAGGEVQFVTTGKQVVYTSGNRFNGGDGSTAFISTSANKMYIDIKNI